MKIHIRYLSIYKVPYKKYHLQYLCKCIFDTNYHSVNSIHLSTASETTKNQKKSVKYKNTILFPSSPFPTNLKGKKRIENENEIRKLLDIQSRYAEQDKKKTTEFILHDGPPYANGKLHMGHVLNKILKDITVRYKYLKGFKVNFQPGWDCHGLPIELKALEKEQKSAGMRVKWETLSPLEIRKKAAAVADSHIESQRAAFEHWGVFADWRNPYITKSVSYVVKELQLFKKLYDKGYIYQDYLPVNFSPSSKTSLAQAELEHNEEHESPSLYLALPLTHDGAKKILSKISTDQLNKNSPSVYLCVWTTTPWTLPANMAVCVNENFEYSILSTHFQGKEVFLIWATDVQETLKSSLKFQCTVKGTIKGEALKKLTYYHPVYDDTCPVVASTHVKLGTGTGLVHTAPAHGREDFLVVVKNEILRHKIKRTQFIDENGLYMKEAGETLHGKSVLEEGNDTVIGIIKNRNAKDEPSSSLILHVGNIIHSYPYDWRTKKPTIIRASEQWFFDVEKVKPGALKALDDVYIYPEKSRPYLISLLEERPYWCISRQRAWGVPIPVFYEPDSREPLVESQFIEHVSALMEREGTTDVWWKYSEDRLLPPDFVKDRLERGQALPVKGNDILDIWFDSGASWYCAMNGKKSDIFLEGIDQIGAWFQSSLLTSVAFTEEAPYKSLIVHGFVVDRFSQKQSKSLGNVSDPNIVLNGGKNMKEQPAYGINVLRWSTVQKTFINNVPMDDESLARCENEVSSLRNTFSFFLASLNNFKRETLLPLHKLRLYEKYILSRIRSYLEQIEILFESYKYDEAARCIYNFTVLEVGNEYMNTTKDILYFEEENDVRRKSVQTVLYLILPYLLGPLEPILPHLVEEVKSYEKFNDAHVDPLTAPPEWSHFNNQEIEEILKIKETFNDKIRELNEEAFKIGKAIDTAKYKVHITAGKSLQQSLTTFQSTRTENHSDLCSILRVSEVTVDFDSFEETFKLEITDASGSICQRCRKYVYCEDDICHRCKRVISEKQ